MKILAFTLGMAMLGMAGSFASPALSNGFNMETFEAYAPGQSIVYPFLGNDADFGVISGGSVLRPGLDIDGFFALQGSKVYYGNDITYSTYSNDGYHCCGFGYISMFVSSPSDVTVEYYGHGSSLNFADMMMVFTKTVSGAGNFVEFGTPLTLSPDDPALVGDIVMIRIVSDTNFAIDDFAAAGLAVIPEPASWTMMIGGFGLVGTATRRRRSRTA